MQDAAILRMPIPIEPVGRFAARTALAILLAALIGAMFALDIAFLWK
jgi:hypothetical protein